jgi:adenylosuccinate synthase
VDELALSLLDVLTGLDEIHICTGYKVDGELLDAFDPALMDRAQCVYETLPGWSEDITACRSYDELPEPARNYVDRVEELVGRRIGFISVGPGREATIAHKTQIEGLT